MKQKLSGPTEAHGPFINQMMIVLVNSVVLMVCDEGTLKKCPYMADVPSPQV